MKILNHSFSTKTCVLHLYLQYPMRLCRWAGFFPVDALYQPSFEKLRFNIWSPYTFYCMATIFGQTVITGFSLFHLLSHKLTLASFSSFVFQASAMCSAVMFICFARGYAQFLKKVLRLERYLTEVWTKKTPVKSNTVAFSVIGVAIVENILSVVFVMNLVMDCVGDFTFSTEVLRNYFMFKTPYVYNQVTFAFWKASLLEVANLQATFLWSFTDVFIMCFSLYLTSYCQDINHLINNIKEEKNIDSWEQVRIHYYHLLSLVKLVDTKLSYFVLLSFFIDLFFVCLQLFNTLNQGYSGFHSCGQKGLDAALNGVAHTVYYSFSFLFLILRAMIMSLLASNVHEAARKPILALRSVASSVYSVEIQRFMHQITYTKLALSGLFFHVTRSMILKVAAALITYELVLLQFTKGHGKNSSYDD